jgi:hypothetical protein
LKISQKIFLGTAGPQKTTKIARQVANLPGEKMLCYAADLHGIVHTHNRNSPVEGQGFF